MAKQTTSTVRTIDELKKTYEELNTKKIQSETNFATAKKQLAELQQQSETEFGTSDVAALKQKLDELEAENETRRRDYQELLERIASDLKSVEQDLEKPTSAGADSNA